MLQNWNMNRDWKTVEVAPCFGTIAKSENSLRRARRRCVGSIPTVPVLVITSWWLFISENFRKEEHILARANKAKMLDAIEFKLLKPTANQAQVAEIIGITDRQLRNWENDPEDKSGWNKLNDEIAKKAFGKYALPAIGTLVDLSKNAKSELVRLQASQDILDRAGYKPTDKQEISIDEPIVLANSWVQDNGS